MAVGTALSRARAGGRLLRGAVWVAPASVLVLALSFGGDGLRDWLRYDRQAVLAGGELWRLLTAHWVHLGPLHALLNIAGLNVIHFGFDGWRIPGRTLAAFVFCQLGVSAALLAFSPQVGWYVGLSGALHGYLLALVLGEPGFGRLWRVAVTTAVVLKVGREVLQGPAPGLEAILGGHVLVMAHVYGAVAGALWAGAATLWRRRRSPLVQRANL